MRARQLAALAARRVRVDKGLESRARAVEGMGFGAFDALHLASAERARAHVFLTTDDKLLRRASRLHGQLRVRVANPLAWLNEVLGQ